MAGTEQLTVELVRDDDSLGALAPAWQSLHATTGARNPFLAWGWTLACREHIWPGATPFVLVARAADGRVVGIAPLCLDRKLGLRVLRFMGDGRSDYLGFLTDPGVAGVEARLLAELGELRGSWDVAVLRHLTGDYSALEASSMPPELPAHEIEGEVASHLTFAGDWEQLVAEGPRGARHARRWVRRFEKKGGEVLRLSGRDALARLDEVCAIEARSWKGQGGTARFAPGPGRELLRSALENAAPESMEIWLAVIDGQAIAFQINFLAPGSLLYYQGAYDQEQRSHYAGGVLHHHALAQAWADDRREYDFMVGAEGYKADWTNATRTLRYLALHPPTLRGRAAYGLLVAPRWRLKRSGLARASHARWTRLRGRLARGTSAGTQVGA